jgi:hypothetical protein
MMERHQTLKTLVVARATEERGRTQLETLIEKRRLHTRASASGP